MKRIVFLLVLAAFLCSMLHAQTAISPKGTRIKADSSLWALSGTSIYNKNTGNVGIGTNIPASILDIQQTINNNSILQIRNNSNGAAATGLLALGNDARAQQGVIYVNSSTNTTGAGANSLNIQNKTAAPLTFATNAVERVRIDGAGKVGIGSLTPTNTLEVNSGAAGASGLTITQLSGNASRLLGVSTTGVIGIFNPADKVFSTQTSGGTMLPSPTVYPALSEMAESTAINAHWTTFANMNRTLVVGATTSIVTFTICGGITINVTSIGSTGTSPSELAIGLFVDGLLRSVKNILNVGLDVGSNEFTITSSGSVTGLSAGSHTFQVGILPRIRTNATDWYLFSNATAIGGFPEFSNRATTTYNVIDL